MNNNYLGTISIAKRASAVTLGADVTYEALEESRARLILLASDSSEKTVRNIVELAEALSIPVITIPADKIELGKELGKATISVMAITDTGLAASIGKKLCETSDEYIEISKRLDLKLKRQKEREEKKKDPLKARPKKQKEISNGKDKPYKKYDDKNKPYKKYDDKDKPYKKYDDKNKPYKKYDDKNKPYKKYDDKDKPYKKYDDKDKPYKKYDDKDKPYKKYDDKNKPYKKSEKQANTGVKWSNFNK